MKKLIFVAAIAVVLICLLAAPALAAKPNLVFVTHITSDGVKCPGNSTGLITLATKGVAGLTAMHLLGVTGTNANPGLDDGLYPFRLNATDDQKATLTSYFGLKGWPPAYVLQIAKEISGESPFFLLKVEDGAYSLVDGFIYGQYGVDTQQLRIDDDYPVGTYKYAGSVDGNGVTLNLVVTLKVVRVAL
jgi:hypothetical protein